jgi:hypothetical protein
MLMSVDGSSPPSDDGLYVGEFINDGAISREGIEGPAVPINGASPSTS